MAAANSKGTEYASSTAPYLYGNRYDLGIGTYDNVAENLDSFLSRFEMIARAYELPSHLCAVELSKSLTASSLEVFEMMDNESRTDFDSLAQALR